MADIRDEVTLLKQLAYLVPAVIYDWAVVIAVVRIRYPIQFLRGVFSDFLAPFLCLTAIWLICSIYTIMIRLKNPPAVIAKALAKDRGDSRAWNCLALNVAVTMPLAVLALYLRGAL